MAAHLYTFTAWERITEFNGIYFSVELTRLKASLVYCIRNFRGNILVDYCMKWT